MFVPIIVKAEQGPWEVSVYNDEIRIQDMDMELISRFSPEEIDHLIVALQTARKEFL